MNKFKVQTNNKQRQLLAEFLSNLSIAFITVGALGSFFDPNFPKNLLIFQFTFSLIIGIFLIIVSLMLLKDNV